MIQTFLKYKYRFFLSSHKAVIAQVIGVIVVIISSYLIIYFSNTSKERVIDLGHDNQLKFYWSKVPFTLAKLATLANPSECEREPLAFRQLQACLMAYDKVYKLLFNNSLFPFPYLN